MISSSELKKIFAIFLATVYVVIVLKADYVLYSTNFFRVSAYWVKVTSTIPRISKKVMKCNSKYMQILHTDSSIIRLE